MAETQLVWLKRDLRVADHGALAGAARAGPVLAVYVFEPSLWSSSELDPSHLAFVEASLAELEARLDERGARLVYRVGELPEVFDRLHGELSFGAIWAHEETGLGVTYARDRRVARWCRERGVAFREVPQEGVFRPHPERDGWARRWEARMSAPLAVVPEHLAAPVLPAGFDGGRRSAAAALGLGPSEKTEAQVGGEAAARALLESFLAGRVDGYPARMSSPVTAWEGCSRLSPHLAFGTVSTRTVHHALRRARAHAEVRRQPGRAADLDAFAARLRWRGHFMQKLEDEPALEHRNGHRAYDGLRTEDPAQWSAAERARFAAWIEGRTGFPMVDASMRCLHRTGWVSFRMRAMLASFATHHLWLHWRAPAVALAPHFLDFEPGIHFAQFQMQAGTMGINQLRVYNVTKQARDHDPEGVFIRRWLPELARVPAAHLAAPQLMPTGLQRKSGCVIGKDYPAPVVDQARAARLAKARLEAVRREAGHGDEAARVARRHGSRRRSPPGRRRTLG